MIGNKTGPLGNNPFFNLLPDLVSNLILLVWIKAMVCKDVKYADIVT